MISLQRLGDHIDLLGGGTPSKEVDDFWGGSIPWATVKDLKHDILENTVDRISQLGLDNSSSKLVRSGSILIATRMAVGRVVMAGVDVAINQDLKAITCDDNIDTKFLYYFLQSQNNYFNRMSSGATVKGIKVAHIMDLEIPLPPLAEQKKIAAILDAADQLRQKDQQLIDHYTALSQSLFLDMFGDPVSNPMGWEKDKMGRHFRIQRGGSPRPINDYLGGTYPWIKIGDGTKGEEIYLRNTKEHIIEDGLKKTRLLPAGSIIFANCGVSLGFARIITFEGCIHDGWLSFSNIDESVINKIFLLKTLNSITNYFRATAPDGTQPNLNTSIMKKFELILPPIELQDMFVERLQAIENAKAQAKQTCELSISLFESLLQRAFKGELTSSKAA